MRPSTVKNSRERETDEYSRSRQDFIRAQFLYLLVVVGISIFFFMLFTSDSLQILIDQSSRAIISEFNSKEPRSISHLELGLILSIQIAFSFLIAFHRSDNSRRSLPIRGLASLLLINLCFIVLCATLNIIFPPSLGLAICLATYISVYLVRGSFLLQRQIKLSVKDHFRFETAKKQNSFLKRFSEEIMQDASRIHSDLRSAEKTMATENDDATNKWLVDASKSLVELNNYIDVIHQFSRFLEIDPHSVHLDSIRVLPILKRILHRHADQIRSKNLKVQTICNATDIIRTDEVLFEQIVANLISNAVKYCENEGHIWIEFELKMQAAFLRVKDEGPGIDPKFQKKIFEKFFRIESQENSDLKGNGLGLYLSRFFARLLQGDIQLESKNQPGANFELFLPQSFG